MKPPETNEHVVSEPERRELPCHLRILLAEDNEISQELLIRILGKAGHEVHVAKNGREVLDTLKAGSFDVVIMDIQMPVMSGLEATKAIRGSEAGTDRHLPIVGVSAAGTSRQMQLCSQAGMDGFISKPFKQTELFAAIEKAVARSSTLSQLP